MPDYKYDNPDDAYKEALRRIKKAKDESATMLWLDGLGLTTIPQEAWLLLTLRELYLHNNQLTIIPPEIGQLTALTNLRLQDNHLAAVPYEIGQLTWLTKAYLQGNQLIAIPSGILQLTRLTTLILSNNQLTAVPAKIKELTELTMLRLDGNQLATLPSEISQLRKLRVLNLSKNQLIIISREIFQLTRLNELYLGRNRLTEVRPELGQLTGLIRLHLDKNQLTNLPSEISQLTNLQDIDLRENQFAAMPPGIFQLQGLKILNFSGNQLTIAPPEVTQLIELERFDLGNNPDLSIPPEIISQWYNAQAILNYIHEINVAPAENIPLNEAKVILVGRGEAGKTSLIKRLVHNSFDPKEPQTDGVNVTPWQLFVDRDAQGIVPIALNIWDFGGQEILHATHKFFLTERSLYLIVIEPRQDDYRQQVEYWLSLIHDVAADSPVIIVINKIDLQRLDVDRRGLQKKHPNIIQAFTPVSADTSEGIDDLKTAITTALTNMDEVDTPFPPSWMRVKQALTAMKAHRPYMPYYAYEQLCTKERVTDKRSQRSLIGFLHRLGIVLNFQNDGRLRGTNVLDPNWISNGVYSILTNKLPQIQKGILRRNQLPIILSAAYEDQHEYVLQMMFKFELAYELELDRESFLIPDLIAEEEPAYEWDDEQAVQFEYQYEVLRRSTLHRLMVRRHKQINPDVVWRTGVMLQKDGISALIRADIEAKTIRISINGKGNDGSYGPRQFLYDLRGTFADIHDSIKGTKPQEVVPIPDHPTADPIGYTYLLQLEKSKLGIIPYPDKNGQVLMLDVQKLLDGVSTSAMRKAGLPTQQASGGNIFNIAGDFVGGDKAGGDKVGGDKMSFAFLNDPAEDIYTVDDGVPFHDDGHNSL